MIQDRPFRQPVDAQKFHAARRKALLSFPTGPSHAANSKSSGWFRSHPEDLLHRNRRHSGPRDAAALTEGSNASFSFPLPLRSTRSLLRNGDPPAHPKFIDNRGAAFTPRKFMDRFNNHAAIAQNMKCVVNRFLVSHLKHVKRHGFLFELVYNLDIAGIFGFCQCQEPFSIHR